VSVLDENGKVRRERGGVEVPGDQQVVLTLRQTGAEAGILFEDRHA